MTYGEVNLPVGARARFVSPKVGHISIRSYPHSDTLLLTVEDTLDDEATVRLTLEDVRDLIDALESLLPTEADAMSDARFYVESTHPTVWDVMERQPECEFDACWATFRGDGAESYAQEHAAHLSEQHEAEAADV